MGREYGLRGMTSETDAIDTQAGNSSFVKILAIGDPDEWCEQGNPLPIGGQISFMAFEDLSEATLGHLQPSVIYSPVLARSFDCIEMAMLLESIGFAGIYRAFATDLPKPQVIEREVRQFCKRFTFEIVQD